MPSYIPDWEWLMGNIIDRRNRDGSTTFLARVRRRGAKPLTASFTRKTDAKRWIQETECALSDGRYFEQSEDRKHTLAEAIDRFLADDSTDDLRPNQLKMWKDEIGHMLLGAIKPVTISDVLAKWKRDPNKRGEKRGPSVLNRYLSSLSVVFTSAWRDWGWAARNPARDVRRFKEPRGRVRFLSEDERRRLLEACASSYCPYIHLIVVLALSTGMRKGEIRHLRWSDVDLEQGTILLLKTKNNERRRVAVRGLALDLFRKHSKVRRIDTDFVFPGEESAKNGRPFEITKAWDDVRRRSGIENFVFHDLRHSAASYLAMNGATPLEIAEVLGHKSLDMVKRYSHLAESHVAGVVERMNKRIFETNC
jgi:integrase